MEVKSKSVGIVEMGFYVPEKILANFDLEKIANTTDEWIRTRTGIRDMAVGAKIYKKYRIYGMKI